MQTAPLPSNEADRLAALIALDILDSAADEGFDVFTSLASQMLGMPISAISLVAKDRQWFKSAIGLSTTETPRDVSFCAHAILQPDEVMCVPDALQDERFRDNPLVVGDPGIRFYAGAPIVDRENRALGVLCVIDREPRQPSEQMLTALRRLAKGVSAALQLHGTKKRIDQASVLERALQVERELSAQQRRFITIASHELRTPIAIVDSATQRAMAKITSGDIPGAMEKLVQARQGLARMIELVEHTLATARVDANQVQMNVRAIDVRRLLDRLAQCQAPSAPRVEIVRTYDSDALEVAGDAVLLDIIFTNLLSNALKYSGDSSRIIVSAERRGDSVRIDVTDFGIGIPSAEVPRLFTRFFRASNAVGIQGTGLGLSLVRDLVELHRGSISVQSNVGAGSTFSVLLPAAVAGRAAVAA